MKNFFNDFIVEYFQFQKFPFEFQFIFMIETYGKY